MRITKWQSTYGKKQTAPILGAGSGLKERIVPRAMSLQKRILSSGPTTRQGCAENAEDSMPEKIPREQEGWQD